MIRGCKGQKNWDRGPGSISRYYDNSVPDPAETATAVNQNQLDRNKLKSQIDLLQQRLKNTPPFAKVQIENLTKELAALTQQYSA